MSEPEEKTRDPIDPVLTCPECRSGVMRLRYITYFTWLNQELITVPNFPAWVCDMCGRRDYDSRAVNWLNHRAYTGRMAYFILPIAKVVPFVSLILPG